MTISARNCRRGYFFFFSSLPFRHQQPAWPDHVARRVERAGICKMMVCGILMKMRTHTVSGNPPDWYLHAASIGSVQSTHSTSRISGILHAQKHSKHLREIHIAFSAEPEALDLGGFEPHLPGPYKASPLSWSVTGAGLVSHRV